MSTSPSFGARGYGFGFLVGPRSLGGAVSYVRISDMMARDGRRILEPVQALEHEPENWQPVFGKAHAPRNIYSVAHHMDAAHRAAWEAKIVASQRLKCRLARAAARVIKMPRGAKMPMAGTGPAIACVFANQQAVYFHSTFMTS